MIRNKVFHYLLFMIIVVAGSMLLVGCGQSKKEVLSQYKQSVQPILSELEQEGKKWDTLRSRSSNGQISDLEFAVIVKNELLPNMLKLQERMESIEPNKELRATHELGIKMISKNGQAMNEVMAIFYTGDMSKITSANHLLTESRELERKYVNQLEDFLK
ncbi:hypothetical protein [Pelosinus propionicus]|uniref:Uncharacterized protein n=1 Tax=Pelosinus propionicus DSM 13327 TaxID=1123291 RepID=A0A1I4PKW2_9FIRM|nr:hypothetical protein [Pelosinus propionicus]SFM28471.1 hypothetical protein SAMN04490355_106624 [Pelosinus propionicus DSM 13327]